MKRYGGAPAAPDGCACHPRARAQRDGFHWICCRDPRDGKLVWSWVKTRADVNPHDLKPDEVTEALEIFCVRQDMRKRGELSVGDDAHA